MIIGVLPLFFAAVNAHLTPCNQWTQGTIKFFLEQFNATDSELPLFFHFDNGKVHMKALPNAYYALKRSDLTASYMIYWWVKNPLKLPTSKLKPLLQEYMHSTYCERKSTSNFAPSRENGLDRMMTESAAALGIKNYPRCSNETLYYQKGHNLEILVFPVLEYFFEMYDFYKRNFPDKTPGRWPFSYPTTPMFDPVQLNKYKNMSGKLASTIKSLGEERARFQEQLSRLQEVKTQQEDLEKSKAIEDVEKDESLDEIAEDKDLPEADSVKTILAEVDETLVQMDSTKRIPAVSYVLQKMRIAIIWLKAKLKIILEKILSFL